MTAIDHESTTGLNVRALLVQPLFGAKPHRTAIGCGWLGTALVAVLAAHWLPQRLLGDGGNRELARTLDGLVAFVIVLVIASILVGIGYGLWNGGPLLAALIAAVPVIAGTLTHGRLVLDVDVVLALCGAGAAASLGTYSAAVRAAGTFSPRPYTGISDMVAVSALCTVLGATTLSRLQAGSHAAAGIAGATLLLVVALGMIGIVLLGCLRTDGAV